MARRSGQKKKCVEPNLKLFTSRARAGNRSCPPWEGGVKRRLLDHDNLVFAEEQEWKLIYHGLNGFLKMWTHHLESHHVGELVGQQRGPPADGQILRVHAVGFAVLCHPAKRKRNKREMNKSDT